MVGDGGFVLVVALPLKGDLLLGRGRGLGFVGLCRRADLDVRVEVRLLGPVGVLFLVLSRERVGLSDGVLVATPSTLVQLLLEQSEFLDCRWITTECLLSQGVELGVG